MTAGSITVTINGTPREIDRGSTILDLVSALSLRKELIAIELNREIVRKGDYHTREVEDGDQIEVVEFVGGG